MNNGHGAKPLIGFLISFTTYIIGKLDVDADSIFKNLQWTALILSIICGTITIFNFGRKEYKSFKHKLNNREDDNRPGFEE